MTAPKTQKKPVVKKTPVKKLSKTVEKPAETVAPVLETSTESVTDSVTESVTETKTETKVDPTIESITNLIGKFELFEKESKLAKVELRKVLKSYQKKTSKKTRSMTLIGLQPVLLNHP